MSMIGRIVILLAVVLAAPMAMAADDNIGCGLGSEVWKGKSGLVPHILGATTNGSFGNQTFGLSTGTLGCDANGTVTASARTRIFADANLDRLARDMAHGQGEALTTLAHLMGVAESDRSSFYGFTQKNFATLFSGDEVTADDMLRSLTELMKNDEQLAGYVRS